MRKGDKEYEKWLNSCDFIRKEMQFYSYKDFLSDATAIKSIYLTSDILVKQLYKWYVYSRNLAYGTKCKIWDYLNGSISYEKLTK